MNRQGNISRLFAITLLLTAASFANPPSPESIKQNISASKLEWEKFENETLMLRMQFDLSGRLLSDKDKTFFCELAVSEQKLLDLYVNQQQAMLEQIEKYEGDDWERLYGSTGLWRQLAASIEATKLNKARIDRLHSIICEDSQPSDLVRGQLLKRKLRSYLDLCEALKVSMEQIKLFGLTEPDELNNIAQPLYESDCKNDLEMWLSLAILQRKFAPDDLQNTLSRSPQTATLLGKLILADMSAKFASPDANLASFNPADAELAAIAALQTDPRPYADLIIKLAENERFQSPAVLYAAATVYRQTQPEKVVGLLIKSSDLQLKQTNVLFNKTAEEIAMQAFNAAYQQFTEEPNDCQPAIDAYDNYSRIAPDKIDEQSQYLYADLLNNCSKADEAAKAFDRLARQSQSLWGQAASLELIKIDLLKGNEPNEAMTRLRDFILGCKRPEERATQLRMEAMNIYCTRLLERDSVDAAEKVLDILDTALPAPGLHYEFFRAQAFHQLGRLEESIHFMSKAFDANDCSTSAQVVSLVSETLDKIELWRQNAHDFNQMLLDCATLADFADKCLNNRQTNLIFAEITILQGKRCQELFPTENDIHWLRLVARHLMAEGDFNKAASLWAKIAELRRNDLQSPNQKSYGWWQAKFYELDCLSNTPHPDKQNITHTIEVLENTYTAIPSPWAQKLQGLKKHLQSNR